MNFNFIKNLFKTEHDLEAQDSYKKSLRSQSKEKPKDPSRRKFVKDSLIVAGGSAVGAGVLDRIIDRKTNVLNEFSEGEGVSLLEEEVEIEELYEELADDEIFSRSTDEILDYSQEGEIEIDSQKMLEVKEYWKNVHSTEGNKLHESLKKGFFEIGAYEVELRRIFNEENVPEKFIYLAIPESYWDLDAVSQVKATGPYQFMKQTARDYGLYSDKKKFDYRKDPFKSARAAAKLLSDLYRVSGDWDLALSGYNGGHIWRYLAENRGTGLKPNYEDFLKYIEKRINNTRNEIKIGGFVEHRVTSTLGKIAYRYGVSVAEIANANSIENPDKIRKGQIIKIPLQDEEAKKRVYNRKIAGYRENLNYPAKFNAIYEAIEEGVVKDQKEPENFTNHITNNCYPGAKKEKKSLGKYDIYISKEGDNLYQIYLKNAKGKMAWPDFQKLNQEHASVLRTGKKVKIPKSKKM